MKSDVKKTKAQLLDELTQLRQRLTELEGREDKHRQTEEALAQERNLLRTLIDNVPDHIYVKDKNSRFVLTNTAVVRHLGAPVPAEVVGKTDFDFSPPDLAAGYYADEMKLFQTGESIINQEQTIVDHYTNSRRLVLSTKIPVRDSQGQITGLVGINRDITELTQTRAILEQSKQQIQNILESITDAFFAIDRDWNFTYVNRRAEQLLRRSRQDLLGQSLWQEFPSAVDSQFYMEYQRAMVNRVTVEFEAYYEPLQGWFRVHAYPYSDGISVYFRDITARKRAEAMLAQRVAQLALINDISGKVAAVLDLDSLLKQAATLVQEIFNYHHVALFLLDQDKAILRAIAGSYLTYFPPNHSQRLTQGIIGWVATHGEKVLANDVKFDPRYISLIADHTETRAELCLPIKIAGQTIGVLDIQSPLLNGFSENDIVAMETLTDQIAVAIENARLYQAVQQELAERKQAEEALRQSQEQVLNLLNHLEELVDQRTVKLTQTNERLQLEIFERAKAERALRESEAKYRLLMEQASDGIFISDRQGHYLEVNPKGCEMLGYTRAELLTLKIEDIIEPENLAANPLQFQNLITGQAFLSERWLRCKNGQALPVEISAKMLVDGRFQAIIRDITERKQAQESLQRYTNRLKALQGIDRAILNAQSPQAIAQAALDHLQQLVPCCQASVVGFDFDTNQTTVLAAYTNSVLNDKTRPGTPDNQVYQIDPPLKQNQEPATESLIPPLISFDSTALERTYINVPLIARDQLIGSLNLGTAVDTLFTPEHLDIAHEVAGPMALAIHQARLYEQVQSYAAELERRVAERTAKLEEINAELKSFTFSVSHDLRAPLRAVQGFARALVEDCGDQLDPLGRDYALRIRSAAERMDTLVQELLVYSRLSRADLRLQPVDLAVIMADVLTQLEVSLGEQQANVVVQQPLPHVLAHYATLAQVLSNLITNAVKFVNPGVTPHIRLWTEIVRRDDEPGEWVRLWVEDNGIGIAPENLERIFQIFERLHGIEAYPGSGIGLAMVRKGVNRMGGHVGVESQLGQGSRFWIELPKAM